VIDLPNDIVQWAHHGGAVLELSAGATWAELYMDDAGQIYGTEDETSFNGPRAVVNAPVAVNITPSDGATQVPDQTTFTWSMPDSSVGFPVGFTRLTNFQVKIALSADMQTGQEFNYVPDTACVGTNCSYTWPETLTPGTTYYWFLTGFAVGPIGPPYQGDGLPGIGPNGWAAGSNILSFTTQ
jgi:hypothetical protein